MYVQELADELPEQVISALAKEGVTELRPAQEKAVRAGLLQGNNLLVCTPTASGKTLIAELTACKHILEQHGKAVYIVPLVALASEKHKEFKRKYMSLFSVMLSAGDLDSDDGHLARADLIICTAEKFDSLLRHRVEWLREIKTVIVDEVHLLNDYSRGPTLEIIMTILKHVLPRTQIIALSATIGNPEELASWLGAQLVQDNWRPVELKKGVYYDGNVEFA